MSKEHQPIAGAMSSKEKVDRHTLESIDTTTCAHVSASSALHSRVHLISPTTEGSKRGYGIFPAPRRFCHAGPPGFARVPRTAL